ncbi:MAG: thiamine phosphate synthase [Pyrinomonadaceae bacterium]
MPENSRLPNTPLIYLITKGDSNPSNFNEKKNEILEALRAAIESGIQLFQIREKQLTAKLLFELASESSTITQGTGTKLLVNARADIALAAKADGVHLPAISLRADVIRQSFPEEFIIGVSTHSLAEAESAAKLGADFVVFGPVFESPGKGEAAGLEELQRVCGRMRNFPVIALGGINEMNSRSVLECGASGFAAIRALTNSENLRKFSKVLRYE